MQSSVALTAPPTLLPLSAWQVLSTPGAGTTFHGRRLIFFNVAESRTEPALLQLFSQHGEVADMFIVRSALGHSSGCGHVTFATAEQARAALKALKGSLDCAEPGTTLGVLLVEEGPSNSSSGTTDDAASTASLSPKAVGASNTAQSQHSAEGKCGKAVSSRRACFGSDYPTSGPCPQHAPPAAGGQLRRRKLCIQRYLMSVGSVQSLQAHVLLNCFQPADVQSGHVAR